MSKRKNSRSKASLGAGQKLNREPPDRVQTALRREVGSGCPVMEDGKVCGNPFLEWHHFDPEWHVCPHHRPEGMIALCKTHHGRATGGKYGGEYTVEQLRELKATALQRAGTPEGTGWLRRALVLVTGSGVQSTDGNIIEVNQRKLVWYERDEQGYALLNIRMPTTSGKPRWVMERNFWRAHGEPIEVVCPPHAPRLEVKYPNGDRLFLEYRDLRSPEQAAAAHREIALSIWRELDFPLTSVECQLAAPGTGIEFGAKEMRLPGVVMKNFSAINRHPGGGGIYVGPPIPEVQSPFHPELTRVRDDD